MRSDVRSWSRGAVVVALVVVGACGGGDDGGEPAAAPTTTSATTPAPTSAVPTTGVPTTGAAASVGVSDFTFQPATVAPGVTVRLANADATAHTVESADSAWTFDEASQTFTAPATPGTYAIFCGIHSSMAGTLTVA